MIKKIGALFGLILGIFSIIGAFIIEGGVLNKLFLLPALIIVFGGTFAATIVGIGLENFFKIFKLIRIAYFPPDYDPLKLIYAFVETASEVRQEGLLIIEKKIDKFIYPFTKKILRFAMDGTPPAALENIAISEMRAMETRHMMNINIFSKMGGYAPTMGIIGTVLALILTLGAAGSDPTVLIRNIATAFIATLWGIFSANLIWFPIADRLKQCHLEEKFIMELSLEGAIALTSGEIPSVVKSRLISMLPQKEQIKILNI
jgi:chemotaxis protein MotA